MPLNDLLTRALMTLGMDVRHAERVLHQRFGYDWRKLPESALYSALERYTTSRGGVDIANVAKSQIMGGPVARQMAKAVGVRLEEGQLPPEGHFQWGKWAYPGEALGYSLGYEVSGGQVTMGAPIEKVKYWRQAGQQGPMAWFENIPVSQMGILAQEAAVPEPVQRVQALIGFGPVGPEGTGYFDPSMGRQAIPFTERIMLPLGMDPTTVNVGAGMQIPTSGDPRVLFPGHTGILAPQFESAQVTQWGFQEKQVGGKAYSELVLQGKGFFPLGADFPQKAAVKTEAISMPGLQEALGVQYVAPMRDPMLAVANIVGAMPAAQRREVFGRDIERWEPGLYQEALEKYVVPGLREHWLPTQTYQGASPITQELLSQGALRAPGGAVLSSGVEGAFEAQRRVVGIIAPFGMQPGAPWLGRSDVLSSEVMRDIQRVHGEEYYQHLQAIAAPRRATLEQVGGAYLANVAGDRSQFMSVAAEKVGWSQANAAVVSQLEEMGLDPGEAPPGLVGQLLMRAVGEQREVRGKGIAFPGPGGGQIVMPNPGAVERWGGQTPVEGMPWGFFKRYGNLMQAYLGREQEGGQRKYELALREAFGASKGSLTEITSSAAFWRATSGAPIGKARMGGRFAPMEGLPANRWFTGRALLERSLGPHVGKGVDAGQLAEDIIMGRRAGPRAMVFRDPLTMPEEQLGVGLGFMSLPELQKIMPGLTREQYETMGASNRISDIIGPAQGGDFDRDWYEAVLGSWYRTDAMGHMIGLSTPESIGRLAAMHPAGELESLRQKIGQITTVGQAAEFLRQAPQTHELTDVATSFAQVVEGKSGMGPAYSAFIRRLGGAVQGTSEMAVRARSEFGKPYMTVQDLGKLEGPAGEIEDLVMRLNAAKFGYIKGGADRENVRQEDLANLRNPSFAMAAGFRAMARWEDVSPESRAVALSSTGAADPKQVASLAAEIERYNAAGSAKTRAASMQRMMQIATGEETPTWEKFAESPFGGVMYSGAAYRAAGREDYTMGTAMAPLAEKGAARQRLMETFYKGARGQMPLEETIAAIDGAIEQGLIPPEQARAMKQVMMRMQITPTAQAGGGAQETPSTDPGGRKPMPETEMDPRRAAVRQALGDIVQGDMPRAVAAARAARAGGGQSQFRRVLNSMVGQFDPGIQEMWREELSGMGLSMGEDPSTGALYHDYAGTTATGGLGARQQAGAERRHGGRPPIPPGGGPGGRGGGWGGPPPGFRGEWHQTIRGSPEEGYSQSSYTREMGLSSEQKSTVGAILEYEDALKKRAAQLNAAIDAGKNLTKEEIRAGRLLGKMSDQLRGAARVAVDQTDINRIQAAQDVMGGMGTGRIGDVAGMQGALQGAGILGGPEGGGRLEQIFGAAKKLTVGFAPFQMRRMWSMLGAPVFNQMIPAAAKAEMAGWQLTQATGAPTGGMPEGIAGGVMQYYAAQRQAQIAGGRAGYRAWGAGAPAIQAAKEFQGVFGPAAGAGGVFAIGAYAVGGPALGAAGAGLVGAAVAAPLAAYAGLRYLSSFGEPTAENALRQWQPGAQESPAWSLQRGIAGAGRFIQDIFQYGPSGMAAPPGVQTGLRGAAGFAAQQERRATRLAGTPIMQLGAQDRMAALNRATELMGAEGTVWAGMDEGQRLGALRQFAPYAPEIGQLSAEGLVKRAEQPDWWVSQAISAGIDPRQYEGMAGQMQMGAGGAAQLTQQALQQPGAAAQRAWGMGMQQLAPLSRFGITPQQIGGYAQGGPFTGAQGQYLQRLQGGDRYLWSQMARGGSAPAWAETMEESGLPVFTSEMWGLQDQATEAQRGYQAFQTGQQWESLIRGSRYQRRRWRLQDRQQATGDAYQRGQFAFQAEGLETSDRQFWESTALAERRLAAQGGRGLEDITRGYQRGMARLDWSEQDLGVSTGRGRTQFGWQEAAMGRQAGRSAAQYAWSVADVATGWGRQQTQFGQQAQDIARGWGRQQTQFGWAQEDLSQRRATSALQFGWQMEDFEENIRFAVGRGRQRLMTQQERAVTMRNVQVGQMETEEGRMEERQRWAEEDHETTLERFRERREWAEEDHDKTVERMREQREWTLEDQETARDQLQERRRWLEEDYEKEKGRIDVRREWLEEDYNRSRDHHEEDMSWAEEQLELRKKHHVEDMDLAEERQAAATAHFEVQVQQREEMEKLDREKWREDYKRAVEALAAATAHRKEMDEINKALKETARQQQLQIAQWNKFWAEGGEFGAIFQQILENLIDVNSRLAITH